MRFSQTIVNKPTSSLGLCLFLSTAFLMDWGFYAHRLINRMAVFTLPPELVQIYKPHIDYLTDHAVDADKRRYATNHEAVRHYIDLDHFGPDVLPRGWTSALQQYCDLHLVHYGDTLMVDGQQVHRAIVLDEEIIDLQTGSGKGYELQVRQYERFFSDVVMPHYYDDSWTIPCAELWQILNVPTAECWTLSVADSLSLHGILPYHLTHQQRKLTQAFVDRDVERIMRLSADMGHYLGDAHVPLHTTKNYNGQLTDQVGIHAFWESRIPELFAEEDYDFFVGKAEYISDTQAFFWRIVLESHAFVNDVLDVEKSLSKEFPDDQQYCFSDRNELTIRTQCAAYAKAYQERMEGMVEQRMRKSIQRIGSIWYTAWVDAGQPNFSELNMVWGKEKKDEELENLFNSEKIKGRAHE